MKIRTIKLLQQTAGFCDIIDITAKIQEQKEFVEKLIPSDQKYHHDERWRDNNGFSHLRAALFGPSLALPIENRRLLLGTWEQVVLLDFDNRPRSRELLVQ